MLDIPQNNQLRWEWIKYQLHVRGTSFAELARADDVDSTTIRNAKRMSCPRVEYLLADTLEIPVWELWPDRHTKPADIVLGVAGFPARLRQLADLSDGHNEFSRLSGLSRTALSNYLCGKTFPTLDRVEKLANALGVSSVWLAFGVQAKKTARKRTLVRRALRSVEKD